MPTLRHRSAALGRHHVVEAGDPGLLRTYRMSDDRNAAASADIKAKTNIAKMAFRTVLTATKPFGLNHLAE